VHHGHDDVATELARAGACVEALLSSAGGEGEQSMPAALRQEGTLQRAARLLEWRRWQDAFDLATEFEASGSSSLLEEAGQMQGIRARAAVNLSPPQHTVAFAASQAAMDAGEACVEFLEAADEPPARTVSHG